ncbi:MAG: sulfatase-like hydrolase/transferase [Planctomycetaceae bacterium]|nr:sulfatase-like hydrolase/transferase [Planctomycetaceae bacterium]
MFRFAQPWLFWAIVVAFGPTALGQNSSGDIRNRERPAEVNRPNVLFLLADDQRADTISAHGNIAIRTPNLDRLVRAGVSLRNAYCFGSPHGAVCIPSRAMLHSGRSLFHLQSLNLDGHKLLGEYLQEAGYDTFATGKWHNERSSFARSFRQGRQLMFGGMSNHAEVPIVQYSAGEGKFTSQQIGEHFSSKLFADAAIEYLTTRDRTQPFFCYVAFTAPHDPRMSPGTFNRMYAPSEMPVPKNFLPQHPFDTGDLTVRDENLAPWPRTREVIQQQTADYYGLISHLDQQVGRVLEALEQSGLADNTIVIYAADHGLALGSHGLLGKQNLYEHSMKAPLVITGPGIPVGERNDLVYLHDLFPTVLEFAGVGIPAECDGRSLQSLLTADENQPFRDVLFTSYKDTIRAIRDQRWKLIRYPQIDRTQLFDLQTDPDEIDDLSNSSDPAHQAAKAKLLAKLAEKQREVGDQQPLVVANPKPAEIDLTGRPRTPDQWQPRWIIEKYFEK